MVRIALLSDVHGNPIALDAVLRDIAAQGDVDAYWALGDHAALGPDPAGALERLAALPNARFTRGNSDRHVATNDRPVPTLEEIVRQPDQLTRFVEVDRSTIWARGYLSATGWLGWLSNLPLEQRLVLPDGTRLLGVHAAPGTDDGLGIRDEQSDDELARLLDAAEADLLFVGHTHRGLDRVVGNRRVVNLGLISLPATADHRASYVVLEGTADGYRVQPRRVVYDVAATAEAIRSAHHPAGDFLVRHWTGTAPARGRNQRINPAVLRYPIGEARRPQLRHSSEATKTLSSEARTPPSNACIRQYPCHRVTNSRRSRAFFSA
jgi:predicted phosphodiesterase